jgi:hypothetical protein
MPKFKGLRKNKTLRGLKRFGKAYSDRKLIEAQLRGEG